MEKQSLIDAGKIVNTHGVRGEVRIEVWLDNPALLKRCGRVYLGGEEKKILSAREHKGFLIALLEGVTDVNAAQALKNRVVQIARADAKLPRGAYFLQDIIGASVVDEGGAEIGKLAAARPAGLRGEGRDRAPDPRRAGLYPEHGRRKRRDHRAAH